MGILMLTVFDLILKVVHSDEVETGEWTDNYSWSWRPPLLVTVGGLALATLVLVIMVKELF